MPEIWDEDILMQQVPGRAHCLRTAEALTLGPRAGKYGEPSDNMADIAALWTVFLGFPVTGAQVAVCMALMKVTRLKKTPGHWDSHVDAAAYIAIASECAEPEAPDA